MVRRLKRFIIYMAITVLFLGQNFFFTAKAETPDILARYVLLIDSETETVLYDKNANMVCYPASTTKVMTALLVMEAIAEGKLSLEDEIIATKTAAKDIPSDASSLKVDMEIGEIVTVRDCLYGALLNSDTYSCNLLAEAVDGSVEDFVEHMNQKAAQLGCKNTNFVNTTGYPHQDHYTTAYSVYLFAKEAMSYDIFREIVNTYYYVMPATNLHEERELYNTNWLLGMPEVEENVTPLLERYAMDYFYEPCIGIKTGTTSAAGNCLVSAATLDGKEYYSVVLGASNVQGEDGKTDRQSFSETICLYEWGFSSFEMQQLLEKESKVGEIDVFTKAGIQKITFYAQEDVSKLLLQTEGEELTYKIKCDESVIFHPEQLYLNPPVVEIYQGSELITTETLIFTGIQEKGIGNAGVQTP